MGITTTQNTQSTRNWFDTIGFVIGWFSVIGQFVLMIQNRQADVTETIIRFFSFFTILTNLFVTLYFTSRLPLFNKKMLVRISNKGTITALTTFIIVVGLVYQIILRGIWEPKGFQRIIDELLHSVIPIFVLLYWALFADRDDFKIKNIKIWLLYPAIYFAYIIIRGHFSNFYPYPFINIPEIGPFQVFINFLLITTFMLSVMGILIYAGHKIKK